MFSPEPAVQNTQGSLPRNPRRRQRTDSDGSRQKPQRKRSKVLDGTFVSPSTSKPAGPSQAQANGHAGRRESDGTSTLEIPLRDREKRLSVTTKKPKSDGTVALTHTHNYEVRHLPSLPDRLRNASADEFRAFLMPSSPYALALTHDLAFIWDYTSSLISPASRTITLPFPSKRSDPLPVGSIVTSGPSTDIGLVVISPTSGKVSFWENVDSAQSLSLFQPRRKGVEGSVSGMLSGETVTDIVDAEHAGFILVFNTGRIAQLTLRDAQGRPQVNVQFLRSRSGASGGGLLGGLKNVFGGGGWRKDISSVKARPSQAKGQMEVVIATSKAGFELWEVSWAGQHAFRGEINAQSAVDEALREGSSPILQGHDDYFQVVDFALKSRTSKGTELSLAELSLSHERQTIALLLLEVSVGGLLSYVLVEVKLADYSAVVEAVIPVSSYTEEAAKDSWIPKLLLPRPENTAFVLFGSAIALISLARDPAQSPVSKVPIDPYQDVIHFRRDRILEFVGYTTEAPRKKSHSSACVLFTKNAGLVRVTAPETKNGEEDAGKSSKTAKSRIEQAIFYGSDPGNFIDFWNRSQIPNSQVEVESAATGISSEILNFSSQFIRVVTSSTEKQLKYRADALRNLAKYLKSYQMPLSRKVKWQLLWDAEKIAAAQGIWRHYDRRLAERPNEKTLFYELVRHVHERYKTELNQDLGERDEVRNWFLRDIPNIPVIIPWAFHIIQKLYKLGTTQPSVITSLATESDDIVLGGLATAFQFREDNLGLYCLEEEDLKHGILQSGYQGLPPFWTSTHNIVNNTRALVLLSRELALNFFSPKFDAPQRNLATKLAQENPALVRLCCQTHMERYRWLLAQDDEQERAAGKELKNEFDTKVRQDSLMNLVAIGMVHQAMEIAEELHDMPTLVELVWSEISYLGSIQDDEEASPEERTRCKQKLHDMAGRVQRYFKVFGDDWADAFYASHVGHNKAYALFHPSNLEQGQLTRWLRADKSRAKISWINEIVGEKNYSGAAQALATVAHQQETNAWCRTVELSLSKLALLAAEERQQPSAVATEFEELGRTTGRELRICKAQEMLYNHVKPIMVQALDEESALDTIMTTYGRSAVAKRPALRQLLLHGFGELQKVRVIGPLLLIDMLTLMDSTPSEDPTADISDKEFYSALKILDAHGERMHKQTQTGTLRLIWKRLFLKDDWPGINDTSNRSDERTEEELKNTLLFLTLKQGIQTDLFTTSPIVQSIAPSDVHGAGCSYDELFARFSSDDLLTPIMDDNVLDDKLLQERIQKCRLDHWFSECKALAIRVVDSENEEKARQDAEMRARVQQMLHGDEEYIFDDGEAGEEPISDNETTTPGAEGFDGDDEESTSVSVEPSVDAEEDVAMEE